MANDLHWDRINWEKDKKFIIKYKALFEARRRKYENRVSEARRRKYENKVSSFFVIFFYINFPFWRILDLWILILKFVFLYIKT